MFRKAVSISGMLLLAGVVVLVTPGLGQAQRGGRGGGFHGGGARIGGAHVGGYGGVYHGGYSHPYYHSHGYYSPYYGSYGSYYPNYGSYGSYYPDYDASSLYGSWSPAYGSGYSSDYAGVAPYYSADTNPPAVNYQSFYPPANVTTPEDTSAHVTVVVPADARVWFDGAATTSTGPVREFTSPPLTPGSWYSYQVRASWGENGREVTQTQRVQVNPGGHVNVSFPAPTGTGGKASAVK